MVNTKHQTGCFTMRIHKTKVASPENTYGCLELGMINRSMVMVGDDDHCYNHDGDDDHYDVNDNCALGFRFVDS